jgi:hypothetical protein
LAGGSLSGTHVPKLQEDFDHDGIWAFTLEVLDHALSFQRELE